MLTQIRTALVKSHQLRSGDDDWDWEVETVEFFVLMVHFFLMWNCRGGQERKEPCRLDQTRALSLFGTSGLIRPIQSILIRSR